MENEEWSEKHTPNHGRLNGVDRIVTGRTEPETTWGDLVGYGLSIVMLIYFCGRAAWTIWGGL